MKTGRRSPARLGRRGFLRAAAGGGAGVLVAGCFENLQPSGRAAAAQTAADAISAPASQPGMDQPEMARFPEKTDLILRADRPPNLETPLKHFREDITSNEAFFVRWHLAFVPTSVDPRTFQLEIGGHVEDENTFTLDELRHDFEPVSLVAVNQCSGNSRRFFEPRVPGGQWGNGAMGNAKWTGVRLRDLLAKAKVKAGAVDVSFQGLDRAPTPSVPNFVKSLPIDRATDGEVMVAYEMNGAALPMLNGYPLRLIVPGWYATYWVKSLSQITVLNKAFDGFWMAKSYRVPKTPDLTETPGKLEKVTVPISAMMVRSLFVRPEPGDAVSSGKPYEVEGLAMDSGKGIRGADVSTDGGKTWAPAALDPDLGKYSWRRWRFRWNPSQPGSYKLMCRAANIAGETQVTQQWNRSGYARNVIQAMDVVVS